MVSTSNVKIINNTISSGVYGVLVPVFGVDAPTDAFYDSAATIQGSAIIEGNSFSGVNPTNDIIKITDGNCSIQNNKFNRNGVAIRSYIGNYTTANDYSTDINLGNHIITNNIFDSNTNGTFDGYESQLCKGLVPSTIYTKNKNQSVVTAIPLFNNFLEFNTGLGTMSTEYGDSNDGFDISGGFDGSNQIRMFRSLYLSGTRKANLITKISSAPSNDFSGSLRLRRSFMFRDFVGEGAIFNYAKIGAYCPTGTITDFSNCYFKVMVVVHNPTFNMDATKFTDNTSFSSGGSLTLVEYKKTVDSAVFSDMQTTTVYNDLATGGVGGLVPGNFFGFKYPDITSSSNGYLVELIFEVRLSFDSTYVLQFTPIEVGYSW